FPEGRTRERPLVESTRENPGIKVRKNATKKAQANNLCQSGKIGARCFGRGDRAGSCVDLKSLTVGQNEKPMQLARILLQVLVFLQADLNTVLEWRERLRSGIGELVL